MSLAWARSVPRAFFAIAVSSFVFLSGAALILAYQDVRGFRDKHQHIFESEITKASAAIETFLSDRQRLVETFAIEKSGLLLRFSHDTANSQLHDEIKTSLSRWFPAHFTFTLADPRGVDLIDDIEGFVGPACVASIDGFLKGNSDGRDGEAHRFQAVIHPQAHHYHFDLMAPWNHDGTLHGVFFVSFYPDTIRNILGAFESQGHNLVLINADQPDLIEITAAGSRDALGGTRSVRLLPWERDGIVANTRIAGSRWELVAFPDFGLYTDHAVDRWMSAALFICGMALMTVFSLWTAARLETRRRLSHRALRDAKAELEVKVREVEESRELIRREVAQQTELARQLSDARDAAEAANKAKSDFLATMSHEIRTPLTGVIGFADMLLEDDLGASGKEKAGKIRSAATSLLTIINDILDMSKLEAGKLDLEFLDFNLPALIDESVGLFADRVKDKDGGDLALRIDLADGFPTGINSDPTRVRQILVNLIGNAVKFTEAGGITVKGTLESTDGGGDVVRIAVHDTGIGIKAAALNGLFRAFTQADASISRQYAGTGLGLSICKRLVEMMGGRIGADSVYGEGSRFWFTLPYTAATTNVDEPATDDTPRNTEFIASRPLHILVAEDVALNQQLIAAMLTRLGHTVVLAGNGQEAVKANRTETYDVILMDVRMPEMSGIDATRVIRGEGGAGADVPIVALTADAMEAHKKTYHDVGMNDFVAKPIEKIELIKAIDRVMGEAIHAPAAPSAAMNAPTAQRAG